MATPRRRRPWSRRFPSPYARWLLEPRPPCCPSLKAHRRNQRWADKAYRKRNLGNEWNKPFAEPSHAKGICLQKIGIEAKQPNSAIRKCARVQHVKNEKKIAAFVPSDGFFNYIDENVLIAGFGRKGHAVGDIPGVRFNVFKVSTFVATLRVTLSHLLSNSNKKHVWAARWSSFIPDLVAAAKSSETICENCMDILKLLNEDFLYFSRGEMTQQKIKELKSLLNREFRLIHELCLYVLSATQRPKLIRATLPTLHAFLSSIHVGFIFESPLLETLLKFFPMAAYRNLAL